MPSGTDDRSEAGFELIHQSVAVLPHWQVKPDAQGRWSVTLQLSIATTRAENHPEEKVVAAAG
jgi:hypothetical protein